MASALTSNGAPSQVETSNSVVYIQHTSNWAPNAARRCVAQFSGGVVSGRKSTGSAGRINGIVAAENQTVVLDRVTVDMRTSLTNDTGIVACLATTGSNTHGIAQIDANESPLITSAVGAAPNTTFYHAITAANYPPAGTIQLNACPAFSYHVGGDTYSLAQRYSGYIVSDRTTSELVTGAMVQSETSQTQFVLTAPLGNGVSLVGAYCILHADSNGSVGFSRVVSYNPTTREVVLANDPGPDIHAGDLVDFLLPGFYPADRSTLADAKTASEAAQTAAESAQAVTAKLDTGLVADGENYKFTAGMMQEAPTGEGSEIILTDVDQEPVNVGCTIILVEKADGLIGEAEEVLTVDVDAVTYAVDFRNDTAANKGILLVDEPVILSGPAGGLSFVKVGRDRSQAKLRIMATQAGSYTVGVTVTYVGGGTRRGVFKIKAIN